VADIDAKLVVSEPSFVYYGRMDERFHALVRDGMHDDKWEKNKDLRCLTWLGTYS
jgi:hypothetical protein